MAWTYPSTKTLSSSSITTADWNTFVRDNLEALIERPTCSLSDAQATATAYDIPTATEVIVRWFSEEWDSHGLHDNAANQSRVTIPSGFDGAPPPRLSPSFAFITMETPNVIPLPFSVFSQV